MGLTQSDQPGWAGDPTWREPGWDDFAVPTPTRRPAPPKVTFPRAIAVAGTVGGAGATTLAILLAATLSQEGKRKVLVLDGAPAGGDMAVRIFGTPRAQGPSWETWARDGAPVATIAPLLRGDAGVVVLGADRQVPDAAPLVAAIIDSITAQGWIVVLDAGSGARESPALTAAVPAGAALLLAVQQRTDGINRARWFFSGLAASHGRAAVADAVVAVTDQQGTHGQLYPTVAESLAGKVAAVAQLPYDSQLASGLVINPLNLAEPTRASVLAMVQHLNATRAATLRPAR